MAERRMFTKKITDSDAFLDMPLSSQALYFHINMAADDEGFVNNPKKIQRMIGASDDDLKLLVAKNFLIRYESGVIVVKHWRMHNYIQKDRFHPTVYEEERQMLQVKENGAYTLSANEVCTECIQDVSNMDTEVRLGKDSIGKVRLGKVTYYPNDEELNKAFIDYMAMRKTIKKPMSDRAIELAMKKLETLSGGDNDKAIEILNQSVMNSWQGLFELKEAPKPKTIDWSTV